MSEIQQWYTEKIKKNTKLKEFSTSLETGAKASPSIPFIGKLFASLTSRIKYSADDTQEIREVVKRTFAELSSAFNKLISAVEEKVDKKLIFIIDGTDHLNGKNAEDLFDKNSNKIKSLESNFIYNTPINMIYENAKMQQEYFPFILPMIKIYKEKNEDTLFIPAFDVLKKLVYKRVGKNLFDQKQDEVVDILIKNSGGVTRDLLRLLRYAILESDMVKIKRQDAEKACERLARDYRNLISNDKLEKIVEVEKEAPKSESISKPVIDLLYDLLLLRYNNHWLAPHPIIKRLPAYKNLKK